MKVYYIKNTSVMQRSVDPSTFITLDILAYSDATNCQRQKNNVEVEKVYTDVNFNTSHVADVDDSLHFLFRIDSLYIESEVLEKIDYEDIIEDFISKNPKTGS
jgi:hypothetical protein